MIDYLITLGAWNWLILGAVFLALELALQAPSCSGSALPR